MAVPERMVLERPVLPELPVQMALPEEMAPGQLPVFPGLRYSKQEKSSPPKNPRVLDAGQCNDSYSLAVIALKLKEVFGLDDINDLPIIYNISWYEQKAVIVLLALLSLGVKNIHLGPTLPAFLSPNVAALLVENFGIAGIDTVENDMELFFGK